MAFDCADTMRRFHNMIQRPYVRAWRERNREAEILRLREWRRRQK